MAFVTPSQPNLADFTTFLTTSVQIPTAALPTNSPWIGYAFNQAMDLVWTFPGAPGILYTLAVYNLATAILFQITPDQTATARAGYISPAYFAPSYFGASYFGSTASVASTYFADARSSATSSNFPNGGFGLNTASMGVVVSASDEGTSSTLKVPDWVAGLTIGQLALLKTPWGQEYLSWAQAYGSVIVGLT
jgi:hypothetical protein